MKGLLPLFLGFFGTFTFSWVGLTVIPNYQIGHLDPQSDEEGTDVYPLPKSGMAERGRRVYTANGCFYCHSRWVRPDYAGADTDRTRDLDPHSKWGERRSAPRDYIFDRPVLLGKMRTGPDLSNIGKTAPAEDQNAPTGASPAAPAVSPAASPGQSPAGSPTSAQSPAASPARAAGAAASPAPNATAAGSPTQAAQSASPGSSPASSLDSETKTGEALSYSAAWHHRHLYSPRSTNIDSTMPAYRFLYEKRRIDGEPSPDALKLTDTNAPPNGWEIVPTYDARCLVDYLMSQDQSHPLNEVKSAAAPASSPAASPAPANPPK